MHLGLDRAAIAFQDGSTSWNDSATNVLALWNEQIDTVQFVAAAPVSPAGGDGTNSVFFANDVYGESFGPNVLALTRYFSSNRPGIFSEADVIFNDALRWDSYRGPIQRDSQGVATYDFHRVALHEFGHALGLAHPDQNGQSVIAIMNSFITDLDHLADDDIAGGQSLYGFRITSLLTPASFQAGDSFSYQVVANLNPTGFSATGLPGGLQIDPVTGLITGTPTQVGTFDVIVTAYSARRNAIATLRIVIVAPRITSGLYLSDKIGSSLAYLIEASNHPKSYEAVGLPAGLQFNPATGIISGIPTLSGVFFIAITAHGPTFDAAATLQLVIDPLPTPTLPLTSFNLSPRQILADPARPRLYVSEFGTLSVIDTNSLAVIQTVTLPRPVGNMSLSADGTKLWLTFDEYSGDYKALGQVDLNTFTFLPELPIDTPAASVREGLDNRLYLATRTGSVFQVDALTGATQGELASFYTAPPQYASGFPTYLEMSTDRHWLYLATHYYGYVVKIDVSTPAAKTSGMSSLNSGFGSALKLTHKGDVLAALDSGVFASGSSRIKTEPFGTPVASYSTTGGVLNYSFDDAFALQGTGSIGGSVQIFDANSYQLRRTISFADFTYASDAVLDNTHRYLLVSTGNGGPGILVFDSGLVPTASGPAHSLLNVSTRLRSQPGDDTLIAGFILTGSGSKRVVVRGIGPSLPVNGRLADPTLELHDSGGQLIAANDNWNAQRAEVISTGVAPSDEHEAAIVATLPPGAYTAILSGLGGSSGVALVELYDLQPLQARVANISTRGKVETDDNVMIGGFIIGGDQPTKVIVRAIGPSLSNKGVAGALGDTTLDLYDANGSAFASNDDWQSDQAQEIIASTVPPTDPHESAIVRTLSPGNYTAIVRGKNNATGVALVEVYNLESN